MSRSFYFNYLNGRLNIIVNRPELQSLKAEAGGLSSAISRTFRMASGISEKVRKLDVEQQRLQETLALLDSISDMKRAASQARTAMETRNYDTAAHSVATFLAQDPRLIQTVFLAHPGPPSPEMGLLNFRLEDGSCPAQILKEIQTKLHQILQESLDNAIKVMDKPAMVSHLKLFPLIGYPQTGLERLLRYLCGIVSRQCQDGLKTATEAIASGASTTTQRQVYVDLLTRLYESIALIIDQQTGLVESIFGKENHPVATMILSLKKEADKQSSLFIDSFCDYRALKRRVKGFKFTYY